MIRYFLILSMLLISKCIFAEKEIVKIEIEKLHGEQLISDISKIEGGYNISLFLVGETTQYYVEKTTTTGYNIQEHENFELKENLLIGNREFNVTSQENANFIFNFSTKEDMNWHLQIPANSSYSKDPVQTISGAFNIIGELPNSVFDDDLHEIAKKTGYSGLNYYQVSPEGKLNWVRPVHDLGGGSFRVSTMLNGKSITICRVDLPFEERVPDPFAMGKFKYSKSSDHFVCMRKFSCSGNMIWAKFFSWGDFVMNLSIDTNYMEEISFAGVVSGPIILSSNEAVNFDSNQFYSPIRIVGKCDELGNILWINTLHPMTGQMSFQHMIMNNGNVIVSNKSDSVSSENFDKSNIDSDFFKRKLICYNGNTGDIIWSEYLPDDLNPKFDKNSDDKICMSVMLKNDTIYNEYKLKKGYRYGIILDTLGVLQELYEIPFEVTDDDIDYLKIDFKNKCIFYCVREGTDYVLYEENLDKFKITRK